LFGFFDENGSATAAYCTPGRHLLQLYHKYKAMATNFLDIRPSGQLYQKRTVVVSLTNSFVDVMLVKHC
jgi:hypothetical protein